MRNPMMLLAAAATAVFALAAAACAGGKTTTVVTGSQASDVGIAVTGRGEVVVMPDIGLFEVGVQALADTVAQARSDAARAADSVIKSLKANGVDAKDIRTSGFSIQPQYGQQAPNAQPRIVGYQVFNTVSVKVRKLDDFSKIIDDAADVGGDFTRLSGVRFGLEDDAKAITEARDAAVADARKKAQQLAAAAGTKLGDPISITEFDGGGDVNAFDAGFPAAPRTGGGTPIETGSGKIVVNVNVRWSIAK